MDDLTQQILVDIGRIQQLDLSKLAPRHSSVQPWNGLSADEVLRLISATTSVINDLSSNPRVLDHISPLDLRNLSSILRNFYDSYINSGINGLAHEQISTQQHEPLAQLHNLNSTIRSSGIYTDLNSAKVAQSIIDQNVNRFQEADLLSNLLVDKSQKITEAIDSATNWLGLRKDINEKSIDQQAEAFYDMAMENKVFRGWSNSKPEDSSLRKLQNFILGFRGSWLWLLLTFAFSATTLAITYQFLIRESLNNTNIQLGAALLRIASLAVPGYLTLFCANQFLYHKRLYTNYTFKFSALNTMNSLIAVHGGEAQHILDKGLNILFSEPKSKESSAKYDPQLVNELVKMLREQINK